MNTYSPVRLLVIALTAAALVACTKETIKENAVTADSAVDGGLRTITVSFTPQTKTTLGDDLQPKFSNGDKILVSNGQDTPDTCLVKVDDDGTATITTKLAGPLTAVYPAKAAKMKGETNIEDVLVSTVQSGEFADANICMAENIITKAEFKNKTAVFCINTPTENTPKYVEVITAGPEIANSVPTDPADSIYNTRHKIHVYPVPNRSQYYVSILIPQGEIQIRDLSFADGYNMKTVSTGEPAKTPIYANTIYTISNQNWNEPYVDIEMTVGGVTRTYKWATRNIGANTETDKGDYFMWGYTVGHIATADSTGAYSFSGQTFKEEPRGDDTKGFDWENYIRFTSDTYTESIKTVFTKYIPSDKESDYGNGGSFSDNKTTLELVDDAANANWGGSWRMPTQAEFDALETITKEWDSDNKGYKFGTSPDQIFLPAAGYGKGSVLKDVGNYGGYWPSSLHTDEPNCAFNLYFSFNDASTNYCDRYKGHPVRAISE